MMRRTFSSVAAAPSRSSRSKRNVSKLQFACSVANIGHALGTITLQPVTPFLKLLAIQCLFPIYANNIDKQ